MSYQSCPSCGGAPRPDRTCKVCGRAGPSTAITQAELDEINARVAELKRLAEQVDLAQMPSSVILPAPAPEPPDLWIDHFGQPQVFKPLEWELEYLADFPRDEIILDEAAELTEAQFDYLLDRARAKKESDE